MNNWLTLAEAITVDFRTTYKDARHLMALADICTFLSTSPYGRDLTGEYSAGCLEVWRRDGTSESRRLRMYTISEERIEFCLYDRVTRAERYFQPHEPYAYAVQRFGEIIRSITWRKPVSQAGLADKVTAMARFFFVTRYR